ncbi:MarR family winged helix-turn-helix transcriptional regulator [Quadrisphaera sp. DSM 44207]|uniref:MarR family winged helix-turn-helix transcriptional regulator n=1 Tax=Quadrisphaera sp. DSM 44207 TaxID=1881057 RepID=UPI00087E5FA3|nr:MarR family transcriptional regulator [Quadrisphaera sp. DSM 44207]SDQ04074.1 DNA-binding transcriptional regulator, MarR family [Quadrisphaera sp. DSM 44207]
MHAPAADDALLLDERLCLALYRASRAMTARYRPLLSELGLTYPQYLVLVVLWEDGTTSVGGIGARLGLESSTLSPLLKRLEAMGLARRRRGTDDERTVEVTLTDEGEALRSRAADIPRTMCTASGLDASESAELVGVLHALVRRLAPED